MATLNFQQLEQLWIDNGGSTAYAPLMAAIAMAESGGNTTALNPNDNNGKQSSFGLWQISTGTHNPPAQNWSDPNVNAQLAAAKFRSQGLGAWGTYTSGAYKQYLNSNAASPLQPATVSNAAPVSEATLVSTKTSSAAQQSGALTSEGCMFGVPQVGGQQVPILGSLPGVGNWFRVPSVGGQCLMSKSSFRKGVGAMLLGVGGIVMLSAVGFTIFRRSGAIKQTVKAAVPETQAGSFIEDQQRSSAAASRQRVAEEGKLQRQQERATRARQRAYERSPEGRYGSARAAAERDAELAGDF
jgi:hypothetical protein